MNLRESPPTDLLPPERLAEAAVWIARLHGEERGRSVENGFRRWLQEDPLNAKAFELATDVWNDATSLRRIVPPVAIARRQSAVRIRLAWAAITAVAVLTVVAGVALHLRGDVIRTAVGEQRLLALEDGTRIFLNTATRVVVRYDGKMRRVELQGGEAIFNVAKKPGWPFMVTAGDRRVTALGTSFVVRRDEQRLAVTLMEGKVVVSPAPSSSPFASVVAQDRTGSAVPASASSSAPQLPDDIFMMEPGQRLTFTTGAAIRLDKPSIEKITAWRRGQVILDDTPLSVAVGEMNRYNSAKLVIEDSQTRELPVNGLFQAGDSISFANAVAQYYGLRVIEKEEEIILSGSPRH